MNKRKKIIIIGVVVVVAIGFLFLKNKNGAIPVKEIEIKHKVVKRTVSASGEVKSHREAGLSFPLIGRLAKLYVKKGEEVKKGQLLAYVQNYSDSQTAQYYKDARDVTLRDIDKYVENYESNLQGAGGADEYAIELRRLNELTSKAEAAYQSQLGTLDKTYSYAPFDGTVVDIYLEEGETVLAGTDVIKVANLDELVFEIDLDQEDFGLLKIDQQVEITLDPYEGEEFVGVVKELPYYVEESGSDFVIEVEFDGENKDKVLLGMSGDAYVVLSKTNSEVNALTFDEIYYDLEDEPFVYTLEGDYLEKTYLDLGLEGDIYTEIINSIDGKIIVDKTRDKDELDVGKKAKIVTNGK
ncbi:efflux RND transporter periplasmic adaptor subunit [Patescibacteria group bacterium]